MKITQKRWIAAQIRKLSQPEQILLEIAALTLIGKNYFLRTPRMMRFAFLHAGVTFATVAQLPPAGELPAIAVPILWAGSFAIAYSLMAVIRM